MSNGKLPRLPIRSGRKVVFIDLGAIDFLEAVGNYVRLHVGPRQHVTRGTIQDFAQRLAPHGFVRIHRSVIVNRRRIRELRPWFTGEYAVLLTTGKELTLSRGYRHALQKLQRPADPGDGI